MTNNPTIDGVSRELLFNKCACGSTDISFCYESPQCHWIRCEECGETSPSFENKGSALDHWNRCSSAVERQELKPVARVCGAGYDEKASTVWMEIGVEEMPINRRVELGEKLVFMADAQSTIAQLQARVQELESGSGEADAWALLNGNGQIRDLTDRWDVAKHWDGYVQSLYFAPPVPVAVVLPERAVKDNGFFSTHLKVAGWNACLDATAALNVVNA